MKTEITRDEYLQIVGLYTLARIHQRKTEDAAGAIRGVLSADHIDHIEDAIWGRDEPTPDGALARMGITVVGEGGGA